MAVKTTLQALVPACTTRRCVVGSTEPMDLNPMSARLRASAFRANSGGNCSWTVVPAETGKGIQAARLSPPPVVSLTKSLSKALTLQAVGICVLIYSMYSHSMHRWQFLLHGIE